MPLVQLVLVLIVVGVLLGLVNRFIPMAGSIKSILNAVVVIGVILWLLAIGVGRLSHTAAPANSAAASSPSLRRNRRTVTAVVVQRARTVLRDS